MIQIEKFRRRILPHWDPPGATFFVTSCLDGSIPAQGLLDIAHYRTWFDQRKPPTAMNEADWNRQKSKLVFSYIDDWLDNRPAVRHFADESLAQIAVDSMRHFAGIRYDLWAFVVMPSHFHWVFQPLDSWVKTLICENQDRTPRERIMQGVKTNTAIECNRLLKRTGRFC